MVHPYPAQKQKFIQRQFQISQEALETKLANHASFNFIEMADAISLRQSIGKTGGNSVSPAPISLFRQPRSRSPPRRSRPRSFDHKGRGRNGGNLDSVTTAGHIGVVEVVITVEVDATTIANLLSCGQLARVVGSLREERCCFSTGPAYPGKGP